MTDTQPTGVRMLLLSRSGFYFAHASSRRVQLWDAAPGQGAAQLLGTAYVHGVAVTTSTSRTGSAIDSARVSKHMSAVLLRGFVLDEDVENEEYTAMELLYETDAYEPFVNEHFGIRGVPALHALFGLVRATGGKGSTFLWDARHCSHEE